MDKSMMKAGVIAFVCTALTVGCTKETSFRHDGGAQIVFGASTEWVNGDGTRTEYSGKDESGGNVGTGSVYERIDWEPGYDRIRILCEAAKKGPTSDYDLTGSTTVVAQKSQAKLQPTGGNGLLWGSETKDHYFYALFPAAGMTSKLGNTVAEADASIAAASGNKATVTGVIPASQSVVKVGSVYKPDMNHAYMYAVKKVPAGGAATVSLSFNPLVTAFEFTLLTPPGDPITSKLTKVILRSGSTNLTGNFRAGLTSGGLTPLTSADITSPGKVITVTLPDGGVQLSQTVPIKLTMLALPIKQTQLTLELVFASGATRKLELINRDRTQWVEVAACKKLYLSNVGVPGSLYYLDVQGPTASFSSEAQSLDYYVKSFRDASGTDVGVGWTATFLEDDKTEWSSTPPSWLTAFTKRDYAGSVTNKRYTGSMSVNNYTEPQTWKGPTTASGNTTKATAIDLSLKDIYGNNISRTTANCYVVTKPGWYKFPCVYGNALKNGAKNESAYKNNNTAPNALKNFVRHDGNAITDPWIPSNVTVNQAKILWMDANNLVTNVSYDSSEKFIYFYVPSGQHANAVIAAEQADGTIVWSWHIWMIEGIDVSDKLATKAVYSHPTNNHSVVEPNYMMNVNLGWYEAETIGRTRSVKVRVTQDVSGLTGEFTIVQIHEHAFGGNVHYQWGRKDPMLGFNEYLTEKTQYYPSGSTQYFKVADPDASVRSVSYGIRNANQFILWYEWSGSTYIPNLWNANAVYYGDKAVVKTVYDPCPIGFKVPNLNAFSGFSDTGASRVGTLSATAGKCQTIGHWQNGWYFKCSASDTEGIFFPATSLRESTEGIVRKTSSGWCWTASRIIAKLNPDQPTLAAYLEFNKEGYIDVARDEGWVSYGFSVRPVKE